MLDKIEAAIHRFERFLIDLAVMIAPWAADVPVAYLSAYGIINVLKWHPVIGYASAVAIEALGLACTSVALEFRDYNATKRKADPSAPAWAAWLFVALYFVSSLVLSLLNVLTGLAVYAILVWPIISAVGTMVHAMRQDHMRRLATIHEDKEQQRLERAARRAEKVAQPAQPVAQQVDTRVALLDYYAQHPLANQEEVAQQLRITRQAVSKHLQRLESSGTIKRNGHGVEILIAGGQE